jgi:protein-disulfide isomerase
LSLAGGGDERRERLIKLGSAAIFVAIVAVAILVVVSETQTEGGDTDLEGSAQVEDDLRGIPQEGLVLGDPRAPVILVEYGDLQCPACKVYAEEIVPETITAKVRNGEAKIEFRNYTVIGEESTPAGAAAIAAGNQGRGWNFVELFYRNQGFEGSGYVTDAFLTAVAEAANVADVERWNRDRKSRPVLAEVSRTTSQAERLGFDGTPSFAIEGPNTNGLEPLPFPESAGELESAIDEARRG